MKMMTFTNPQDLRAWLATNCHQSDGVWLRIYKKQSGVRSVTYAEALDQALCFGWIDGQKKAYDEQSWLQRFTHPGARRVLRPTNRARPSVFSDP
jgi:uncharacterized protein YdeI (YjbR/CyaY-like superfamily)